MTSFHTLLNLLHVQRHPGCLRESELEAQVYIYLVTPIHYSIHPWLLVQTAAKAFSLKQPEIFCSTLSLLPAFSVSPEQSLQSPSTI